MSRGGRRSPKDGGHAQATPVLQQPTPSPSPGLGEPDGSPPPAAPGPPRVRLSPRRRARLKPHTRPVLRHPGPKPVYSLVQEIQPGQGGQGFPRKTGCLLAAAGVGKSFPQLVDGIGRIA